jgi:hypothetical protein
VRSIRQQKRTNVKRTSVWNWFASAEFNQLHLGDANFFVRTNAATNDATTIEQRTKPTHAATKQSQSVNFERRTTSSKQRVSRYRGADSQQSASTPPIASGARARRQTKNAISKPQIPQPRAVVDERHNARQTATTLIENSDESKRSTFKRYGVGAKFQSQRRCALRVV